MLLMHVHNSASVCVLGYLGKMGASAIRLSMCWCVRVSMCVCERARVRELVRVSGKDLNSAK